MAKVLFECFCFSFVSAFKSGDYFQWVGFISPKGGSIIKEEEGKKKSEIFSVKWKLSITDEGQRKSKEKFILLSWSFDIQDDLLPLLLLPPSSFFLLPPPPPFSSFFFICVILVGGGAF